MSACIPSDWPGGISYGVPDVCRHCLCFSLHSCFSCSFCTPAPLTAEAFASSCSGWCLNLSSDTSGYLSWRQPRAGESPFHMEAATFVADGFLAKLWMWTYLLVRPPPKGAVQQLLCTPGQPSSCKQPVPGTVSHRLWLAMQSLADHVSPKQSSSAAVHCFQLDCAWLLPVASSSPVSLKLHLPEM